MSNDVYHHIIDLTSYWTTGRKCVPPGAGCIVPTSRVHISTKIWVTSYYWPYWIVVAIHLRCRMSLPNVFSVGTIVHIEMIPDSSITTMVIIYIKISTSRSRTASHSSHLHSFDYACDRLQGSWFINSLKPNQAKNTVFSYCIVGSLLYPLDKRTSYLTWIKYLSNGSFVSRSWFFFLLLLIFQILLYNSQISIATEFSLYLIHFDFEGIFTLKAGVKFRESVR